jgi:hypothetical protein
MSTPISPIVEGLTNAFSLANMIHNQRIQNQTIQMQQQRMADAEAEQQSTEQRQNTELAMHLQQAGARPATPSDDLESQLGMRASTGSSPATQTTGADGLPQTQPGNLVPSFASSDIAQRFVKAGGQKWVLPSEDDQDARRQRTSQLDTDAAVAKTKATTQAKIDVEGNAFQQRLHTYGSQVTPEQEKLTKGVYKAGDWIGPDDKQNFSKIILDSMKQDSEDKGEDVVHSVVLQGANGYNAVTINRKGKVSTTPVNIGAAPPKPLNRLQQSQLDKKASDQLVSQAAGLYAQQNPDAEAAVAALRKDAANPDHGDFLKNNFTTLETQIRKAAPKAGAMTPQAALDALRGAGGSKPAAQPAAPAAAAAVKPSKGRANGDQIRGFAKAKGVSFAAAVQQAAQEGWDVTGLK